jgi:hypothetical protein
MPIVHKVPAAEAAHWPPERESIDAAALLATVVGSDRVGLTRMEYRDNWGWMARVYAGGKTFIRFYADGAHEGPEEALRRAVAWRDAQRAAVAAVGAPTRPGRRLVRVDRPEWKNVGYFAWYEGKRRYFSDAVYGGPEGARAAAATWAAGYDRNAASTD